MKTEQKDQKENRDMIRIMNRDAVLMDMSMSLPS